LFELTGKAILLDRSIMARTRNIPVRGCVLTLSVKPMEGIRDCVEPLDMQKHHETEVVELFFRSSGGIDTEI
jgi:hypothetical protein